MLRLVGGQVETLFDEALPTEARELPEELARLDSLLADPALLEPVERTWEHRPGPRARSSNDPDCRLPAPDGDQAAHRLGL